MHPEDEEKYNFICDCSRVTSVNQLYIFPGTLNTKLVGKEVVFYGPNKKMCKICYLKSWHLIRKGTELEFDKKEKVTHIHDGRN